MQISTFHKEFIPVAAKLFIENYQKQRQATPILPNLMEGAGKVETMQCVARQPISGQSWAACV